jgi:hypothetical protein
LFSLVCLTILLGCQTAVEQELRSPEAYLDPEARLFLSFTPSAQPSVSQLVWSVLDPLDGLASVRNRIDMVRGSVDTETRLVATGRIPRGLVLSGLRANEQFEEIDEGGEFPVFRAPGRIPPLQLSVPRSGLLVLVQDGELRSWAEESAPVPSSPADLSAYGFSGYSIGSAATALEDIGGLGGFPRAEDLWFGLREDSRSGSPKVVLDLGVRFASERDARAALVIMRLAVISLFSGVENGSGAIEEISVARRGDTILMRDAPIYPALVEIIQ